MIRTIVGFALVIFGLIGLTTVNCEDDEEIHFNFKDKIKARGLIEYDRNPRWLMKEIKSYYGFDDIDFVLGEPNKFVTFPRFKAVNNGTRLEFWIPKNVYTEEALDLAKLALAGKIQILYGMTFYNKSLKWLSSFCYTLDHLDTEKYLNTEDNEEEEDKKPID